MRLLLVILYITHFSALLAQSKVEDTDRLIKFVYSQNIFQNAETTDAEAISSVLSDYLTYDHNLEKSNIKHVVNIKEELDDLLQENTDLFVLLGTEYLDLRNKHSLVPKYSLQVNDKIGFEYIIVVNKSSGINELSQLKGKTISVMAKQYISPTYHWLEYCTKNDSDKPADNFFNSIKLETKSNSMLLSVFFNDYDACIVSRESYELMCELNPQTKEQLKIIKSSPRLLTGLICYNKKVIEKEKEEILNSILDNLHENEYGKQLLSLFSIDKLVPFKENHMQSLISINESLGK